MGRLPIIIPRHQSILSKQQRQTNGGAREPILQADSLALAHPLAFAEIGGAVVKDGQKERSNSKSNSDNKYNSHGNVSRSFGSCGGSIGIRRHSRPKQFSTPEKKKRTRMDRKQSPTSTLLSLGFIEEEGEEEDEPESVISELAVMSGFRDENDEEDDRLSELLSDDLSLFGSAIEHVDESNDFGHDLILPMDALQFAPEQPMLSRDDESSVDRSTGTFREMMLQQQNEMRSHKECEMMLQQQQKQEDNHTASLLTTNTRSSIITTMTLERSLDVEKRHFFRDEYATVNNSSSNRSPKRSSSTKRKETAFQRLLKTASQCHQKSESRNKNSNADRISNNNNNPKILLNPLQQSSTAARSLMLPEEQRRAALARYRYNQIIHTNRDGGDTEKSISKSKPVQIVQDTIDRDHTVGQKGGKEEDDCHVSGDCTSPEDSFATIEAELDSLRSFTLRSNASFRQAESCLSNDLRESEILVKTLEDQLLAAKEKSELCLERYELAKEKRQKEKELTAIRTLHLEILTCGGKNDRSRSMLVERHEHEKTSCASSSFGGREIGILGTSFLQRHQPSQKDQQEHRAADTKEKSWGIGEAKTPAHDNSDKVMPHHEENFRDKASNSVHPQMFEGEPTSSRNDIARLASFGIFEDPYVYKSVEELRVIKNRLEAIKDLFEKARYMVSEEFAFSSSQSDRLRKQRQSQVMIETAASKYILFRSKNLV